MIKIIKMLILFSLLVALVKTARILAVFPVPSISHQVVFRPLTQELARRGHEVIVITTDPAFPKEQPQANLTEIDVHDLSYRVWREKFLTLSVGKNNDIFSHIEIGFRLVSEVFQAQLKSQEVQEIIFNNEGFDLLLLESVPPTIALSLLVKVPVILISSYNSLAYHHKAMGMHSHYFLYPTAFHQKLHNLTYYEKFQELYNQWWIEKYIEQSYDYLREVSSTIYGTNLPPSNDLFENVYIFLRNVHPLWTNNQPVPNNVLYIGGIHKPPNKELPEGMQSYLDSSNNGVIYFSLGTNVKASLLPTKIIQIVQNVFSKLPYNIIWKWDEDDLPGKSENIKISKWIPQTDVLRHPNVKLFITQGGLQSTDEAITAGVPLIGIPMLADQWYNTEKYVYHNIGIKLDMTKLTEEQFQQAIEAVIEDKRYRKNIIKLRELRDDQPQLPIKRAVWWIEHVLQHGNTDFLHTAGANLSWVEYFEIELLLLVTTFIAISLIAFTQFLEVTFSKFAQVAFSKLRLRII